MIEQAGFAQIYARPGIDVFSGARFSSSAAAYGARGFYVRAFRPQG